ncbi:MAG: hypothetical protein ABIQ27_02675 [Flavobacterium sp.]|uniref:hypothetical protein n=1 Tax=Flavobacterium sp. TaxID=239 RepID=UPI003262F0A7
MKSRLFLFVSILFLTLSCSSSEDAPDYATEPETKAEFDNTSFGVYKGVVLGLEDSAIKIVINNGDNVAVAYIYKKNKIVKTLTTTGTFTLGEPIVNAEFSTSGSSFKFSTNSNGSNPTIQDFTFTGVSNPEVYAIHELSFAQVLCYKGGYGGGDYGKFACMVNNGQLIGYVYSTKEEDAPSYSATSTIVDNSFNALFGSVSSGATFQGQITIYGCAGEWENLTAGEDGTFSGKRTL